MFAIFPGVSQQPCVKRWNRGISDGYKLRVGPSSGKKSNSLKLVDRVETFHKDALLISSRIGDDALSAALRSDVSEVESFRIELILIKIRIFQVKRIKNSEVRK